MDQAMPCGLLVSELLSNALKHSFPQGGGGIITVALRTLDHQIEIVVSDTGVGLPANFSEKCLQSLGLQLVTDLVKQLNGTLSIGANLHAAGQNPQAVGTRFLVIFQRRPTLEQGVQASCPSSL